MAYQFWVNMQKRGDGRVYADLHKCTGRIHFDRESAEKEIAGDQQLAPFRHAVPMVAMTEAEFDEVSGGAAQFQKSPASVLSDLAPGTRVRIDGDEFIRVRDDFSPEYDRVLRVRDGCMFQWPQLVREGDEIEIFQPSC